MWSIQFNTRKKGNWSCKLLDVYDPLFHNPIGWRVIMQFKPTSCELQRIVIYNKLLSSKAWRNQPEMPEAAVWALLATSSALL